MIQKIDKLRYLQIGVQGENIANDIQIDVSEWVEAYPGASIHLLFKPYNAVAPSPMVISVEDGILTWQPSLGATVVTGVGYTEVRAIDPETGMIKKSRIIPTAVENSVSGVDSEDPPAPFEDWVNSVLQASEDAVNAKTVATAAKEAAEDARDAAQAAAGDFQGLTASVTGLPAGYSPTVHVTHSQGGMYNLGFSIPKGDKGDRGDPAPSDQVVPAVEGWLEEHITNPSSPPLDTSLSLPTAAAPANLAGKIQETLAIVTGNGIIEFSDPELKQYIVTTGDTVSWDIPSVASGDNYKWAVVSCSPGDKFTINGLGGGGGRLWAFADSGKNVLSRSNANVGAVNLLLTAPPNAAYLIINDKNNKTSYYGEFIKEQIKNLYDRVDYVTPQMFGAVGNNVADDTDALQSAIDTGKPVLIPSGSTIRVDGNIIIENSTVIFGRGRDAIISVRGSISTDSNSAHKLEMFGFTFECRKVTGSALTIIKENNSNAGNAMSIHDMYFHNVNNMSVETDNAIITIKGIREVNIVNCLFYGDSSSYGKGIVLLADSTHMTMNIDITSCNFYSLHTCIDLNNTIENYIYLAGIRMCNNMFIGITYAIKAKCVDTLYVADSMVDFAQRPIDIDSCGVVKIHHNYLQSLGAVCINYKNSKDTECRFSDISDNFLWSTLETKQTDGIVFSSEDYEVKITHFTICRNKGYALKSMLDLSNCQNGIVSENIAVNCSNFVDGHSNSTNNMASLVTFSNNKIDASVTNAFYRVSASCIIKNENIVGVKRSQNSGKYTGNGDGTTKTFAISHTVFSVPQYAVAASGSPDYFVTSVTQDETYLYVTLNEAPASGTGTVLINWMAGV